MTLKTTGVILVAEGASKFLGDLGSADKAVSDFGITGEKTGGLLSKLGGGALAVGKVLSGVLVGGIAAAGTGIAFATKEAISLESAFAGVIKTTDGLADSSGELTNVGEDMLQGFRDLAKTAPVAIEDLMGIGELGGQLGIARDDLLDFTEIIAAVGTATNLTTDEAAVGFAQMANIMGTPTGEIENMASALVALGNNMATTESDIFNFATNIAGAGNIAGLTEAQVLGIGAAFSSVGIEAAAGGTATQKVLLGINDAVLSSSDNLAIFAETAGMSSEDFASAWEMDAGAAFNDFVMGLGAAGDDAVGILGELGLTDQRLIKSFLSLAGAGDLLTDAMDLSTNAFADNSALMTEAEARYRTTESQLTIFKNTLRDVGFTVGSAVLPFLNDMLDAAKPLIEQFGAALPGIIDNYLIPTLTTLGQWLGKNLPVAIETIKGLFTTYWPIIQTAVSNFWGFVQPIFEQVAAWMSGDAPGILDTLSAKFSEVFGVISGIVQTVLGNISAWWEQNGNTVIAVALTIWEVLQGVFSSVQTVLGPIIQTFVENFKIGFESMSPIIEAFKGLWEAVAPIITGILAVLGAAFLAFVGAVVGIFAGISEAIAPLMITVGMVVENIIGIFTGLADFITGFVELVIGLFQGNSEKTQEAWQKMGDAVKSIVGNLVEGVVTLFVGLGVTLKSFLSGFITGVIDFFKNLYNELVGNSIVTDLVDDVINLFGEMVSGVIDFITGFVSDMISNFTEISSNLIAIVTDLIANIISSFKDSVANMLNLGAEMMDGVISGITSKAGAIIEAVKSAIDAAIKAAKNALGIESPSKVMASLIGQPMSAGVASGILEGSGEIQTAINAAINPTAINPINPVAAGASVSNNYNNTRSLTINFEGNYASQPAITDQRDLSMILGISGVLA